MSLAFAYIIVHLIYIAFGTSTIMTLQCIDVDVKRKESKVREQNTAQSGLITTDMDFRTTSRRARR